jgi:hypothetical protein
VAQLAALACATPCLCLGTARSCVCPPVLRVVSALAPSLRLSLLAPGTEVPLRRRPAMSRQCFRWAESARAERINPRFCGQSSYRLPCGRDGVRRSSLIGGPAPSGRRSQPRRRPGRSLQSYCVQFLNLWWRRSARRASLQSAPLRSGEMQLALVSPLATIPDSNAEGGLREEGGQSHKFRLRSIARCPSGCDAPVAPAPALGPIGGLAFESPPVSQQLMGGA